MSCQDLGKATYTSAATVMRFCKKFGCKGYPDFKLRFLSDVKGGQILSDSASVQLSERENMVTLLQKVSEVQTRALDATRKALSLSQLHRIQRLLLDNPYLDFYAYDTNIHLARYAGSQFFHAGKIAAVYSETGAIDTLEKDGTCHDPYRIEYLKAHIEQMKKAVEEDGVELMGYTPWGRIDLVSFTTGELKKRYGFIYVDKNDDGTGTGKRFKKDFFSWFQNVIRTNGEVL